MKITFINGSKAGEELEYSLPEITIGRDDGNILRIPMPGVSRYHARIWRNDSGQWFLSDQGSTNGVKQNGKRIFNTVELTEGDELEIGKQQIRINQLEAAMPKVIFNPIPSTGAPIPDSETSTAPAFAPGMAQPVKSVPAAAEEPENSEPLNFLLDSLKDQTNELFSGKKNNPAKKSPASQAEAGQTGMRFSTKVMLLGIALSFLAIAATLLLKGLPGTAAKTPPAPGYLAIQYSKEEITPDNIFRFAMLLEGNQVTFTVDDIKSQRHFQRTEQVDDSSLEILRSQLERSPIWTMQEPQATRSSEVTMTRKLMICESPRLVEHKVEGPYAPAPFEEIESILAILAEGYNLQTVALTSEELHRQAKACFEKAEDLFDNREGRLENLRNAIIRYQQVENYLGQFSPPPPMWNTARKRIREAEDIRKRKLTELNNEYIRAGQIRDLEGIRQVLLDTIELTDPASKEHKLARQRLLKLDMHLRKRNK
jgi:hypothetical protein